MLSDAYLTQHKTNLVGLGRLELPTSPLSGVRSNQLSYRPISVLLQTYSLNNRLFQIVRQFM